MPEFKEKNPFAEKSESERAELPRAEKPAPYPQEISRGPQREAGEEKASKKEAIPEIHEIIGEKKDGRSKDIFLKGSGSLSELEAALINENERRREKS